LLESPGTANSVLDTLNFLRVSSHSGEWSAGRFASAHCIVIPPRSLAADCVDRPLLPLLVVADPVIRCHHDLQSQINILHKTGG
jgi:hypothetical protein